MRIFLLLWLVLTAPTVVAGMPIYVLTDAAKLNLSGISFFLFTILLSAVGVQGLWASLRKDFNWLPKISYLRSLSLVLLLSLFFNIILLMIAGTRELMTPGAWEVSDISYRLRAPQKTDTKAP